MGLKSFAGPGVFLSVGIYLLKSWANGPMCTSDARLDGKVVVITGANTGIGKATALDLVKRGAKVYLACRSLERGTAAADDIKKLTQAGDDRVLVRELNLGSLASVRSFAEKFKSEEPKVHILVNNAGTMMNPLESTEDGFEMQIGVNHLGHFLLTLLMIDRLKAAAPSRVVVVSSNAHRDAETLGLDQMHFSHYSEENFSSWRNYGRSKLYNILFAKELARRLEGTDVTTYSLHPGVIATELPRHMIQNAYLDAIVRVLFWPFTKSVVHGAQTSIYAAVEPALASESGKFYRDTAEATPNFKMLEDVEEDSRNLWETSVQNVKLTVDEFEEIDGTML
ncbi:hypothetical protein CAPTEDRAFT_225687 [Capitella teleta]|uniref:Retinol dehydrogenase 12 n=1 Tax=Capitella teleta TaxID=283909 RepID=R7V239_CAPTE|nr:hypothetical protein CAPTEDRAFT_225687 [Capitella teleta]|eukprot:ELU09751.1 hypothetical protein CAPTEDRAFT_225687 [Capitella teleta]